jgi:aspartyl-tRNA(Asn)/glutamyl-tRNA(Gln) amidotransferase subunit C
LLLSLSRADVEKVALLSRLQLSDDELESMTEQLGKILSYIDQLSELDTDAVEPMAHALEISNAFRDDEVRPSLPRESALGNAPNADDECFRVPAVLGE